MQKTNIFWNSFRTLAALAIQNKNKLSVRILIVRTPNSVILQIFIYVKYVWKTDDVLLVIEIVCQRFQKFVYFRYAPMQNWKHGDQ